MIFVRATIIAPSKSEAFPFVTCYFVLPSLTSCPFNKGLVHHIEIAESGTATRVIPFELRTMNSLVSDTSYWVEQLEDSVEKNEWVPEW